MYGEKAFEVFKLDLQPASRILDIGPGQCEATDRMRARGFRVTTCGPQSHNDIKGLWPLRSSYVRKAFDGVWACHVLEHTTNPGAFLTGCFEALKLGGILAITVPPAKTQMVGGHVTIWTPGLLLYQLILARFDCSGARVMQYDYNISVVLAKSPIQLPNLHYDNGDLEKLAPFFPEFLDVYQGFDGTLNGLI